MRMQHRSTRCVLQAGQFVYHTCIDTGTPECQRQGKPGGAGSYDQNIYMMGKGIHGIPFDINGHTPPHSKRLKILGATPGKVIHRHREMPLARMKMETGLWH